jgi:hypothetical protein
MMAKAKTTKRVSGTVAVVRRCAMILHIQRNDGWEPEYFEGKVMRLGDDGYWRFVNRKDSDRVRRKFDFSNRLGYIFNRPKVKWHSA